MNITGTYDGTIFHSPSTHYSVLRIKSADPQIPQEARLGLKHKDHLIRFTAVGYELPRTDAVELSLEGEWETGKFGCQFQVTRCQEIVPQTESGLIAYLSSGLIKGIGQKTAELIVARFGADTLYILEQHPEKLLQIRGITENRLEDIKTSFAESKAMHDLIILLAPFKLTPKTALRIYQYFGPSCLNILKKSPFELCQISGFGFKRVDAIMRKTNSDLHDPMRIRGAVFCALKDAQGKQGHLYVEQEHLSKDVFCLLNDTIPIPDMRVQKEEILSAIQDMILQGAVVSVREDIYLPEVFGKEDETARQIALRLLEQTIPEDISAVLNLIKTQLNLSLSLKQEEAVRAAFCSNLSIITGSPGTGKTTVLKTILKIYQELYPNGKIMLMAPTGRASRRMAESTGFQEAKTMHSGLGLSSEEEDESRKEAPPLLNADLIIVDEFSMVDMWLAQKFFTRIKQDAKVILVGDPDQLPSVGAGNVFQELIECGIIPVTVLNEIFRQSKDSLIAHNARLINEGATRLYYGPDFQFLPCEDQYQAADAIIKRYCREVEKKGIEQVQILCPFRSEGAVSSDRLNASIRELVNPFHAVEEEIRVGTKVFRVGDRIMQMKNTKHVSNGDLGFIRTIEDTEEGKQIEVVFGEKTLSYSEEDAAQLELAYATTIHKAMGSEYDTVLMPLLKSHMIMLYRNLIYTGITRAKNQVILAGQKQALYIAIHRNEITKRNTHLGMRISLYYKAFTKDTGIPLLGHLEEKLKNVS